MNAAIGGSPYLFACGNARRRAESRILPLAGVDGVRLRLHQSAVVAARESSPTRVRWARISAWAALSASSASNVVTALYVVRTDLMSVKLLKQDLLRATRGWEASRSGRRSQYRGFRRLFPFRNRQRSATALTSLRSWSRTQACRVRRDTENHAGQRIWRCQQATST